MTEQISLAESIASFKNLHNCIGGCEGFPLDKPYRYENAYDYIIRITGLRKEWLGSDRGVVTFLSLFPIVRTDSSFPCDKQKYVSGYLIADVDGVLIGSQWRWKEWRGYGEGLFYMCTSTWFVVKELVGGRIRFTDSLEYPLATEIAPLNYTPKVFNKQQPAPDDCMKVYNDNFMEL